MSPKARIIALSLVLLGSATLRSQELPHIIFIMADDMGYGDPTCYNADSKIPTPTIDELAREGIRFTDAHAPAAVCVPTRFGLLTGQYPFRMRRGPGPLIDVGQTTIATLLKKQGYKTACVGKWHLGFENEKNPQTGQQLRGGPVDCGFDYYFGIPASLDIPPYYYIENDRCVSAPSEKIDANYSPDVTKIQGAFWRAGGVAPGFEHRDVLPTLTEKAVEVIDSHMQATSNEPLFLYFALPAPHTPWLPLDEFQGKTMAGDYGDFTAQVDRSVARLLSRLNAHGAKANTLVIFTSDNGPVWYDADYQRYGHKSVGPLRGMKGDAWEGGHRMPFVARWPGRIKPGSVCEQTICHVDMLATFAAASGAPRVDGLDSANVLPLMKGEVDKSLRRSTVFQSSGGVQSIRMGRWKLVPQLGSGGFSKPRKREPSAGGPQGQLYDLSTDLGETKNLWSEQPERVEELTRNLELLLAERLER